MIIKDLPLNDPMLIVEHIGYNTKTWKSAYTDATGTIPSSDSISFPKGTLDSGRGPFEKYFQELDCIKPNSLELIWEEVGTLGLVRKNGLSLDSEGGACVYRLRFSKKDNDFAFVYVSLGNRDTWVNFYYRIELRDKIQNIIGQLTEDVCRMNENRNIQSFINLITLSEGGGGLTSTEVDLPSMDGFKSEEDYNLHYGPDFYQFHTDLIERLETLNKGIALLHGEPGTGKTYYIRSLVRDLCRKNKVVYCVSGESIQNIAGPSLLTYFLNLSQGLPLDKDGIILIVEDAESLIQTRDDGARSGAMSNLLNIADGILNDILKIQIIATFNTDLDSIDDAVLREGRLLARKEFKALEIPEARLLIDTLGVEHTLTEPMTVAEIYALKNAQEIIIHENGPQKSVAFGFE